jgi:predicted ATPase
MLTKLTLKNFKNFQKAELALGPLTVIIGANASGKSNLRDAFRFLHGLSRGYSLSDVFGEKYGEGGELVWSGIRGGTREACYPGSDSFVLTLEVITTEGAVGEAVGIPETGQTELIYEIEVAPGDMDKPPKIIKETLEEPTLYGLRISTRKTRDPQRIKMVASHGGNGNAKPALLAKANGKRVLSEREYDSDSSIMKQIANDKEVNYTYVSRWVAYLLHIIGSCRFFDFSPNVMREPSLLGQDVLGDRGENLSSILRFICRKQRSKETLLSWLRQLTPMDVVDLDFVPDARNRILLVLVEQGGLRISADSASDGTLRFLAMLAAMLGPKRAKFNFFEEIENGLHPTRLHLVTHLLEKFTGPEGIQVVATTHSPTILHDLGPQTLEHVAVTYRNPDSSSAGVRRMLDIADAATLLRNRDVAQFHSKGWFEDALYFTSEERNGS